MSSFVLLLNWVVIGGGSMCNIVVYEWEFGMWVWSFMIWWMINGLFIIVGDDVIVGGIDGCIYVLFVEFGEKCFEYEIGGMFVILVVVIGLWFVVVIDEGLIFFFEMKWFLCEFFKVFIVV